MEVKGPGESCVRQCIALETVSLRLVGDPQLVGMTSLKTNRLLVSRDIPPQPPCTH